MSTTFALLGGRAARMTRALLSRVIAPSFSTAALSTSRSLVAVRSFKAQSSGFLVKIQRRNVPSRTFVSASAVTEAAAAPSTYDAGQIQVLEGLEPVRKRPGMYIGSTGPRGLHHLVYEVLDNAIDEVQAGFASAVDVVIHPDSSVSVTDNGRGIPTDTHPSTGKSALETVLTILHAGGKFGGDESGYTVSGGLHGVGVSVVNALSESLVVTVWRNGLEYQQSFQQGKPTSMLTTTNLPPHDVQRTGTCITFRPDTSVFQSTKFDYDTITGRLREVAFLNPEVTINFKYEDPTPDKVRTEKYHFGGGLVEYVQKLNEDKQAIHEPISFKKERDNITVDVALQWCSDGYSDTLLGYANSIRTSDGGTHMDGLKAALTRSLNTLGRKSKAIKEKEENLSGEHVREGLTCIISVKVPSPEFEGQTKTRLGNMDVRKVVEQTVQEEVTQYLDCHPNTLETILSKALQSYKAAEAAKRARDLVRRKNVLKSSTLPGKLADCTCSDPRLSEIFIVEGESAGGSTKQGRDRQFQAVLPLRGKILNVERKDDAALYKNQEIQNLILALGLGTKGEFSKKALRYQKIIILTDADIDGAHIRTLLLTFFFRYQRALFEEGYVYVGVPPLYKVERGKQAHYCYNESELQSILATFPSNASYHIQRFKGLGEMMPLQLWETTLDPSKRMLKKLTLDDAVEASLTFTRLMGDKVEPRRELIQRSAAEIKLENLDV